MGILGLLAMGWDGRVFPDSERSGFLLPLHHASIDGTFGSGQRIPRIQAIRSSRHSMIIDRNFEIQTEIWDPKLHIFRRDRLKNPPDYI
jgi:hypothetical protein